MAPRLLAFAGTAAPLSRSHGECSRVNDQRRIQPSFCRWCAKLHLVGVTMDISALASFFCWLGGGGGEAPLQTGYRGCDTGSWIAAGVREPVAKAI